MNRKKNCILLATVLLSGCLRGTRNQLNECTADAQSRYTAEKSMPMGQPFKDILACMHAAGYAPQYFTLHCKDLDYTSIVSDPLCYRPTGWLSGYAYDVSTLFR